MEAKTNIEYDYIEYYVGMAKMVAYWHVNAMGFKITGFKDDEQTDEVSYLLEKNKIRLVITSAGSPKNFELVSFVDAHGNGVKRIAIKVDNIQECRTNLFDREAIIIRDIYEEEDDKGVVKKIDVKMFDDNVVTFSDYSDYSGELLPGYDESGYVWGNPSFDSGLSAVDHIACALRENESRIWENYVNNLFSSETVFEFEKGQIATEKSGMNLKVLRNESKSINNVLVEPDSELRKSQVQVFLDGYYGTGIQHIAFHTEDIFSTIESLQKKGVEFVNFPPDYYDLLEGEFSKEEVEKLRKSGILCERSGETILMQTFTLPIGDRPTLFYEIIQRVNNYDGFGIGNITTLFKAVEKSMEKG